MQSPVSYISKAGGDTCKRGIAAKYAVKVELPADRRWRMRDFVIVDPTGSAGSFARPR